MKNIRPAVIATDDLTSNVLITETEYAPGTFTAGHQAYVGINLYEVVAPSTSEDPVEGAKTVNPDGTPKTASWILIGQINQWRMFNGALHEPTVQIGGPLAVAANVNSVCNAIAVLKCEASEAIVTVTDPTDGVVYDRTVMLDNNDAVIDLYDYFFEPIDRKTEFVLLDLPPYAGAEVSVTLRSGDTGDTACGALVLGLQSEFGSTSLNFTLRDRFFSRRERNAYGAFLDVLSRPVAREATFEVLLSSTAVSQVMKLVRERRDVPTVFIGGENYEHSIVFGFPDEPEVDQRTQKNSRLKLTILGQT